MKQYDANEFILKLNNRLGYSDVQRCPFCGGEDFSTPPEFGTILLQNNMSKYSLGSTVPVGLVICEKCGHVEFFSLGTLGLLTEEGDNDGEHKD